MRFYVEKDTDLMRSTFKAIGLARLLEALAPTGSGLTATITDQGSAYIIDSQLTSDDVARYVAKHQRLPALLPAIFKPLTAKERASHEEKGVPLEELRLKYVPRDFPRSSIIDYEAERARPDPAREDKKQERVEGETDARHPDYPVWAHLCSFFGKGSAMRVGYPMVVHGWYAHHGDVAQKLFDLIEGMYGVFPNVLVWGRKTWHETLRHTIAYEDYDLSTDISSLAIVSPSTSKGTSLSSAAQSLNEDTPEIFWLEIYLAFAGYMVAGLPYNLNSDAAIYYPLPLSITLSDLQGRVARFRQDGAVRRLYSYSNLYPRTKLDALAHINFYRTMALTSADALEQDPDDPYADDVAAISGLVGYYYKNIATQIPFDETVFRTPPWLPDQPDAAMLYHAADNLSAHHAIINAIRGDHADELAILQYYREFISLGTPEAWIEFTIAYNAYRFRKQVDMAWLPLLSVQLFKETLPMAHNKPYHLILEDEGFKRVAQAIYSSTSYLRYWKDVKKQNIPFRVRHGLGDDLRRAANDRETFIAELGAFLHDYIRESSNVQADSGYTRPHVSNDDIYAVVRLMDDYGPQAVANLLVAVGYASRYAKDSHQPKPDNENDNS